MEGLGCTEGGDGGEGGGGMAQEEYRDGTAVARVGQHGRETC